MGPGCIQDCLQLHAETNFSSIFICSAEGGIVLLPVLAAIDVLHTTNFDDGGLPWAGQLSPWPRIAEWLAALAPAGLLSSARQQH